MEKLLTQTRRHDISFDRNGLIRLSAHVVRTLDINQGDSINIELSNGEYLLCAIRHDQTVGRYQACCHSTKKKSNNMYASSVRLCRALLDRLSISESRASFAVGLPLITAEGVKLPIITRQPITN